MSYELIYCVKTVFFLRIGLFFVFRIGLVFFFGTLRIGLVWISRPRKAARASTHRIRALDFVGLEPRSLPGSGLQQNKHTTFVISYMKLLNSSLFFSSTQEIGN